MQAKYCIRNCLFLSNNTLLFIATAACGGLPAPGVAAEPAPSPPPLHRAVTLEWNARLRHESVDDDAFGPAADRESR